MRRLITKNNKSIACNPEEGWEAGIQFAIRQAIPTNTLYLIKIETTDGDLLSCFMYIGEKEYKDAPGVSTSTIAVGDRLEVPTTVYARLWFEAQTGSGTELDHVNAVMIFYNSNGEDITSQFNPATLELIPLFY